MNRAQIELFGIDPCICQQRSGRVETALHAARQSSCLEETRRANDVPPWAGVGRCQ